jgi:hypothetical protein
MDILTQALDVAKQAEAASGTVTLTFDLGDPSQRSAYAAALAVLRINGLDETQLAALSTTPAVAQPEVSTSGPATTVASVYTPEPVEDDANPAFTAELRRRYAEAMSELTPDEARRETATRETFPRVVDLLRDGANVEAVAQIQYRRWLEEHIDTAR